MTDNCPMALRKMRDGSRLIKRVAATVISLVVSTATWGVRVVKANEGTEPSSLPTHTILFDDDERGRLRYGDLAGESTKEVSIAVKNACRQSESVVLAEYLGYHKLGEIIDSSHPLAADFLVLKILKGPSVRPNIAVLYNLPVQADSGRQFSENLMPARGSQLILCIKRSAPTNGVFETFHGCGGWFPFNAITMNAAKNAVRPATPPDRRFHIH
jgi:hypothetical protein